jgi:hypothetical protein
MGARRVGPFDNDGGLDLVSPAPTTSATSTEWARVTRAA